MNETSIDQTLTLEPPKPVPPVDSAQASTLVKLDESILAKLDGKVADFLREVMTADVSEPQFRARLNGVHAMGNREIQAAAAVSNGLLERPVRAMHSGVFDEGSAISKSLLQLRETVERLDPSRQGDLLTPKKWLGFIPGGNKAKQYFESYQSAQAHLNAILQSLYNGQDELRKDNAALEQEKVQAWEIMGKLQQYIYLGQKLDEAIERHLPELEAQDAEKARVVREEMLFYTRQKVQDLLTQLAVTIQGYLAMDVIRKNNLELIKGVDRATSTTVSALRTAVIVAQALTNQKLVLEQIAALNTTTSNLIGATSQLLQKQAAQTHEQAVSATVSVDQLKLAFQNIFQTMDAIAGYKTQALTSMQQTIQVLSAEVEKGRSLLDRVRSAQQDEVIASLPIETTDDIHL